MQVAPMCRHVIPLIPDALRVVNVITGPEVITIACHPRPGPTLCPGCGMPSIHRHGHYERTVSDLPWQGRLVHLRIRLARFLCRAPSCPRRTFAERLRDVVRPHGRRSERPRHVQRHLGLALGGEPAARLARRLSLPASADTFLRLVRSVRPLKPDEPRVIGVDEWAWRRDGATAR